MRIARLTHVPHHHPATNSHQGRTHFCPRVDNYRGAAHTFSVPRYLSGLLVYYQYYYLVYAYIVHIYTLLIVVTGT